MKDCEYSCTHICSPSCYVTVPDVMAFMLLRLTFINYSMLTDWSPYPAEYRTDVDARYEALRHDATKTREEITRLLQNIRPDEDLPSEWRSGTPKGLAVPLMEHQKLGLAWLKQAEQSSNKGGNLADDMGLGKTVQALALMVERRSEEPTCKTTLIVAPVALMRQWSNEIKDKIKSSHCLSCYIHHGPSKKKSYKDLMRYDVVLTTYGCLVS